MRERLIELLKGNLPHFTNDVASWNDEHIGELADHLLANGVIVPPCKIGDTVYFITGIHSILVNDAKVEEIYIGDGGFAYHVNCDYLYFTLQQSEVYFSKEEAERALKGEKE